jgi:hypothetical protein
MLRKPSAQADNNEPVLAAPLIQCVTLCQYCNSFLFVVGGAGNTIAKTTTTIKMRMHQQNLAGQSAATVTGTGAPAEV